LQFNINQYRGDPCDPRRAEEGEFSMRKLLLIAGLAATLAAPSFSQAATSCERAKSNQRVAGTVAGGLLGALAGSAIAGNSSNTAGVVVGGVAGAVAGNQLAKSKRPCPPGYVQRSYYRSSSSARRVANTAPRCTWENQAYRDGYGNVSHRQVQVCR
jgi:hypothetical protein